MSYLNFSKVQISTKLNQNHNKYNDKLANSRKCVKIHAIFCDTHNKWFLIREDIMKMGNIYSREISKPSGKRKTKIYIVEKINLSYFKISKDTSN